MDVGAAAVNSGEALHDERSDELDLHVPAERDPHLPREQRSAVPQCPRPRVHRIIAGIDDEVSRQVAAPVLVHLAGESHGTNGESLPVRRPLRVAAPALVDCIHASWGAGIDKEGEEEEEEEEQGEVLAQAGGEVSRNHR